MTEEERVTDEATRWMRENKCVWSDADKSLRHENGRFVKAASLEEAVIKMRDQRHHIIED